MWFKELFGSSCSSTDVGFKESRSQTHPGEIPAVSLMESVTGGGTTVRMLLVRKDDVAGHPGTARILGRNRVNMDMLRYWMAQCYGLHPTCTTAMNTTPTVPALLVDVKKKCIVPGLSGCRYVALSYRFGSAPHFKLDQVMLVRLRREYELNSPDILMSLPLTVRHAIALVEALGEALGESHLWTDSLCIIHENPSALAGQLEQMAAIYSSAVLTIVATDGDGTSGILGLSDISRPRNLSQEVIDFGVERLVVPRWEMLTLTERSDYHQRGWTFQEYLMSPRKLIFFKGEAHWVCQCRNWHEDLVRDNTIERYAKDGLRILVAGLPSLSSLETLLSNYNDRCLTYDEDALPAIAGLLAVLNRTFTGGFLYGLPVMMFDAALTWSESWVSLGLIKRTPSRPIDLDQEVPTWSWLAWQGSFQWGASGEAGVTHGPSTFQLYSLRETSPITEWYASSALEGRERRKIIPTWYKERERAKDHRQRLADGWSRHEAGTNLTRGWVRFFPDGCGSFVYRHHSNRHYWYYPFRVPSIEPSTPSYNPPQTRYLFCKTRKSMVLACSEDGAPALRFFPVLYLRKDKGRPVIGTLALSKQQLRRWHESEDTSSNCAKPIAHRIEVVAINRVVEFSTRSKEAAEQGGPLITRQEYVTVLWVEWEGGVAYRQACGRIEREAWERLDLEEIDLVLG